jgi:hypothetical protein
MSFKRLDAEDISISAEAVVTPLWSTGLPYLTAFFTSSNQVAGAAGPYYYEIFQADPLISTAATVQFAIAYGDQDGSGSAPYNSNVVGKSPSSTIYGQYRNLVFGNEDTAFTFGTVTSPYIYAISVDRSRYKEKLFPGTFNLRLGVGGNAIRLTDNSVDTTTISYVDAGRVYDIISGSNGSAYNKATGGTGFHPTLGSYGKFLPDVGIVILNGRALDSAAPNGIGLNTGRTSGNDSNLDKFYSAIYTGASASLQSEETVSSNYVFVRVRNSEFNYSTNPSNTTGSGELRHDIMINTPQAYMTTVGLYNDSNDLLAVAKLSKPLLKDFTKEALVRIKLDY